MSGSKSQQSILERIRGGLIVSCQALPEEPLHSSYIMGRMAFAAKEGGAAGIRANTVEDITEIKKTVDLPVIGIIKKDYEDCEIYITPTMDEVDALAACGADIIALDCTRRLRPGKRTLDDFFAQVRDRYPEQLFMADCSDYEEGMHAAEIGLDLMKRLVQECGRPVIAEGGIWTPAQLKAALDTGVWAAVVGTAITRPREITKRFVAAMKQ